MSCATGQTDRWALSPLAAGAGQGTVPAGSVPAGGRPSGPAHDEAMDADAPLLVAAPTLGLVTLVLVFGAIVTTCVAVVLDSVALASTLRTLRVLS